MAKVKRFNVVNPKEYESQGEKKTFWAPIGTITEFYDANGSISGRILEMNNSEKTYQIFEQEQKDNNRGGGQARQSAPAQSSGDSIEYPQEDINPEDIPF